MKNAVLVSAYRRGSRFLHRCCNPLGGAAAFSTTSPFHNSFRRRSRSKRHSRGGEGVDNIQTALISPLELDSSIENYVSRWMEEAKKNPVVEYVNLPHSNVIRASMKLELNGQVVRAIGQSTKKKQARVLCFMHASRLMHYYQSTPVSAPPPLPMETRDPSSQPHSKKEEQAGEMDSVDREKKQYLSRLQIPPSPNKVVNEATDIMRKGCGDIPMHDPMQRLNQRIPSAASQMVVVTIPSALGVISTPSNVYVATLTIDRDTQLVATGVGRASKLAKVRCAIHALHILNIQERSLSCSSASLPALVESLPKHNQLLFRYLHKLFGIVPRREFQERKDSDSRVFRCKIDMDGVVCEGEGMNYFEAERRAMDTAISEMQLYDERVTALNKFVASYPRIEPESIPYIRLPNAVCEKISCLIRNHAASAANTTGRQSTNAQIQDPYLRALSTGLKPSAALALSMRHRLSAVRTAPVYLRDFHPRRSTLAMAHVRQEILDAVHSHPVVVIAGTTGCGKTTQVPQYLLDDAIENGRGDTCSIIVTQPRRLSTFSVAHRIAAERLSSVGQEVGYAVRLDTQLGTHLNICTTGVLLQILTDNPDLSHISYLVIDEVHERDINCDLLLSLTKDLLKRNSRIRVILMSATIEADLFSRYFLNAPIIRVEGAVYPVAVHYLGDAPSHLTRSYGAAPPRKPPVPPKFIDYEMIASLVYASLTKHLGSQYRTRSILVFLPGWKELMAARHAIETFSNIPPNSPRSHLILLHSSVDSQTQRSCFIPPPEGTFKVVLATNIAESGITIDDVAVVIDSGLIKETSWVDYLNPQSALRVDNFLGDESGSSQPVMSTQLTLKYASRANCQQRTGRAGRTQGGTCYRLFTREVHSLMLAYPEAEIHRLPLSQVMLKCLQLGHSPEAFLKEFIDPPHRKHIRISMTQLRYLGAVTNDEQLTPLGLYLSRLPCDPRIGKMIVMGSVYRCMDSILTIAAAADATPFISSRHCAAEVRKQRIVLSLGSQSDQIASLNAYNGFCRNREDVSFAHHNYMSVDSLRIISQYKQQYYDILSHSGFIPRMDGAAAKCSGMMVERSYLSEFSANISLVKACIASSLYPNIALLDHRGPSGGKKKRLLRTRALSAVTPSSDSVCRRVSYAKGEDDAAALNAGQPALLYVFQDIFRVEDANAQFLRQVSSISLWALLLFSGSSESFVTYSEILGVGVMEEWLAIRIEPQTFKAVCELRRMMDDCLLYKYRNPTDATNNRVLESVCSLFREVLSCSPSEGESGTDGPDTGRIVSPLPNGSSP